MADITEYEHPTDYVVIPVAMRDRLWATFQKSEARVKNLEGLLRDARAEIVSFCESDNILETPDWVRPWFEIDNLRFLLCLDERGRGIR